MTLSLGPIWAPSSLVLASQHPLPVQLRPQGMSPHTLSSQDLPSVSLLLLLPPSHPDKPKPMSVQSLVVFTSGENHPPVQAGVPTGGRPLPLTGSILAGFYTPLQKSPVFLSKGHTRHHSAQSLNQTSSLLQSYAPSFLPAVPAIHRSDPSSNPTCYSQMLL